MISILVAYDDNRLIGDNGQLPWHIPKDLKFFKRMTIDHPIIMGRKTWDSLPIKPLPKRMNIVLTRDNKLLYKRSEGEFLAEGPIYFPDIIHVMKIMKDKDAFIIGGAQVYELALKLGIVDRVIVSRIKGSHQGDTYFPLLLEDRWACRPFGTAMEGDDDFEVVEYIKKN